MIIAAELLSLIRIELFFLHLVNIAMLIFCLSSSCTIIYIIKIHFTMQNLHLLEILSEDFRYHVPYFQCLAIPVPPGINNGAHGTEKLLKTEVSEILHSEVNLIV